MRPQPEADMNLFVVDANPDAAALALCDQHINKMILETAQILDGGTRPLMADLEPGRDHAIVTIPRSHRDNPCIRSAADARVWDWAYQHLAALLREFAHRYGHPHSYDNPTLLGALKARRARVGHCMTRRGFYLAIPEECRMGAPQWVSDTALVVPVYRTYYVRHKLSYGSQARPCTWRLRAPPQWLRISASKLGRRDAITSDGRYHFFEDAA